MQKNEQNCDHNEYLNYSVVTLRLNFYDRRQLKWIYLNSRPLDLVSTLYPTEPRRHYVLIFAETKLTH